MKTIYGLKNIRALAKKGTVITIGVFDGVHVGHQKIISLTARRARKQGFKSVVVTFEPNPAKILHPGNIAPTLISLNHRIRLIERLGVDFLVIINFTKAVAEIPPEKFLRDIAVGKFNAKEICVGENFYFGKGAEAGIGTLKRLVRSLGLKVKAVKHVKKSGRIISSSLIRKLIARGRIGEASRLLGRPVSILGTVVAGSGLARQLGYPTANINPHHEVIPPKGVYAIRACINNKLYKGILNIGMRPTFYAPQDKEPTIEAHIFNFKGDIYDKDIEVFFIRKIRDEFRFKDKERLVAQIEKDETLVRRLLKI